MTLAVIAIKTNSKSFTLRHFIPLKVKQHKFMRLSLIHGVNMVLNIHRNHRVIRDGGKGWEGGMEVGEEEDYIPIATLSPPE